MLKLTKGQIEYFKKEHPINDLYGELYYVKRIDRYSKEQIIYLKKKARVLNWTYLIQCLK